MIFITSIISSQEWMRLKQAAEVAFPGEALAQGEILRRFSLSGAAMLRNASAADKQRVQYEHQSTQRVAGPEGKKARLKD